MGKAKLRKKIRRLKKENLQLIIESNAARARAGEASEAYNDYLAALSRTTGLNG